MSDFVVYNGIVLPREEVRISPENRGMMYGDGFFDTLRSYKGRFLLLENHFERILRTAGFLGINVGFGYEDFRSKILELLESNSLTGSDALVRVQCWREGERGYATSSSEAGWFTSCKVINFDTEPIKLITSSIRLISASSVPRDHKFSNGMNYIHAGNEALASGADDALMLTLDGVVGEISTANIFWVSGDTIFTPSADCDLFPGITRKLIIDMTGKAEGLSIQEGRFSPEQLKAAEAVFCTNSVKEIFPVMSLDGQSFDTDNPVLGQIAELFDHFKAQYLQ